MLMDNALHNRRASLEQLALEDPTYRLDKSQQTSDWSREKLSQAQLRYAALDVETARLLWSKLRKDVQKRSRKRLATVMQEAQMAVAYMQLNGIGFDAAEHRKLMHLESNQRCHSGACGNGRAGESELVSAGRRRSSSLTHLRPNWRSGRARRAGN